MLLFLDHYPSKRPERCSEITAWEQSLKAQAEAAMEKFSNAARSLNSNFKDITSCAAFEKTIKEHPQIIAGLKPPEDTPSNSPLFE